LEYGGEWGSERALYVSVVTVFFTFTEIRFTVRKFRKIVTPKYPTNVITLKIKKTEGLSVEIIALFGDSNNFLKHL